LDKDNRVVLVGNPLHNPPLWELYKRTIQKMIDNDGVFPEQSSKEDYKITPVRNTPSRTSNAENLTFFMNIFEIPG